MANSVDLDDLGLHCLHMPFLSEALVNDILGHLPSPILYASNICLTRPIYVTVRDSECLHFYLM